MGKLSLLDSVVQCKCPNCREGDLFIYPFWHLTKFNQMHKYCPVCHDLLEPEPGFYQGAMYVGYGFTVAILTIISVTLYLIGGMPNSVYMIVNISTMILVAPLNYRYSRVLYLYWFGKIR